MLSTVELKKMKLELKEFSSQPIAKSYKIIATIYKSQIEPQSLIDSEITKAFVRIGMKKFNEDDDEKLQKSIKICRKMVKAWKETLGYEHNHKNNNNGVEEKIEKKIKIQQVPMDEFRVKAIAGIKRYLSKSAGTIDMESLAQKLEEAIFKGYKNIDEYKMIVKKLARSID